MASALSFLGTTSFLVLSIQRQAISAQIQCQSCVVAGPRLRCGGAALVCIAGEVPVVCVVNEISGYRRTRSDCETKAWEVSRSLGGHSCTPLPSYCGISVSDCCQNSGVRISWPPTLSRTELNCPSRSASNNSRHATADDPRQRPMRSNATLSGSHPGALKLSGASAALLSRFCCIQHFRTPLSP